ncbi:hypothetical protein ACJMK2_002018 [Sinanodonta woodiana]|uniref:C-terminal of Roc (COR) domain-containing protein n=1 Tax=Sinanodonta woodiana TaxID=1069815 RepID=A0ABD3XU00_SINWO
MDHAGYVIHQGTVDNNVMYYAGYVIHQGTVDNNVMYYAGYVIHQGIVDNNVMYYAGYVIHQGNVDTNVMYYAGYIIHHGTVDTMHYAGYGIHQGTVYTNVLCRLHHSSRNCRQQCYVLCYIIHQGTVDTNVLCRLRHSSMNCRHQCTMQVTSFIKELYTTLYYAGYVIHQNVQGATGTMVHFMHTFVLPVSVQQMYCRKHGQRYLKKIRSYLRDKPTSVHLVDEDFAIDNSVPDSKLEELKKKIVEVASQQRYWGEQIPTRWFLLEQQLMRLRDACVKVVSYSTVENLNKEGTVRIEKSEELDLFLRYLHETGTIIYFSIEALRDNILLDPKWMIDALKLLINAQPNLPVNTDDNNTESSSPAASAAHSDITQKWSDFKEKGILTVELVDVIWTKEKHPDLHKHKEHILKIMEQLNILARPRSFNEMGEKVENYFLTPCMLRRESPKEVISPEEDSRIMHASVQPWLEDEGHDSDAPIMPEHINQARLYVALATVCTNALREILLTHVPEPHTNIYQAIQAKKADLTKRTQARRGQWQNSLLLPDQCQVVFPDPFGRYVASVDQFDISVLYILIRHVSTVSASVMGWGIDPIEKLFRDKCLGANVERIRLYRNQIGHSMDGKISQQEFDDYWNKIDAVLDDIEVKLGSQGFRAQLEKQRIQVISVYETC